MHALNRFTAVVSLVAVMGAPALAVMTSTQLNPQPEPPGRRLPLADGNDAIVEASGKVYEWKLGKAVLLPPGPCHLKNGTVMTIDATGRIVDAASANDGSAPAAPGAGKVAHPIKSSP